MHFSRLFDPWLLAEHLAAGYVSETQHNTEPELRIYNYTPTAQYARMWDEVTTQCRGLILHGEEVIARPFPKFFNLGETAVPKFVLGSPATVLEKQDGSLGSIFWLGGVPHVATRGSFHSDQAEWATNWLHDNIDLLGDVPDGVTPLVEIIYPQNRIVVDYGQRAELVLLAAIDIETGADIPIWEIDWWDGARTDHHVDLKTIEDCTGVVNMRDGLESEGFVMVWYRPNEPSFRLKIKGEDYVRLHRIIFGTSTKTIWETLKNGGTVTEVLDVVPDEFYDWVRDVETWLNAHWQALYDEAHAVFGEIRDRVGVEDRKAFALEAKDHELAPFLFLILDNKYIGDMIWDRIEPAWELPFQTQGDS